MWSNIIGHKKQIEQLRRSLAARMLPNAYVFAGPAGVGKRLVANAFTAALFCSEAPARGHDACGECIDCRKLASGNHPDLFVLAPEESERGVTSNIKVEPAIELLHKLMFKPLEAPAKVAIIDGADRLLAHAANSLLKCLEEPPERTHFILITPMPHKLLPTIRSRCQFLAFPPLPEADVAEAIARLRSAPMEDATRIARLAQGSLGLAMELEPSFVTEILDRFVPLFSKASTADVIETAQAFSSLGQEKITLVFDILASWYRDLLRLKATSNSCDAIHPEAARMAPIHSETRLMQGLARLNTARLAADTAANKQLMFENLLFTLTA